MHCLDTQKAQPHCTNADVALAHERCCVTSSYLQTLVWDVNAFSQKRETILFFKKIDFSYSLVVFFVLCPHLRPFWTIFTRLAPFWCSTAKTDFLLAVEHQNSTNSLKMPQNSLRHEQLNNKKYNNAIRYTGTLRRVVTRIKWGWILPLQIASSSISCSIISIQFHCSNTAFRVTEPIIPPPSTIFVLHYLSFLSRISRRNSTSTLIQNSMNFKPLTS